LVVVRVVARDIIEIPELLPRLLAVGLEGFSPSSFMEGHAAVR
jgi:hypothetical protein